MKTISLFLVALLAISAFAPLVVAGFLPEDINEDNYVDKLDLHMLRDNWGPCIDALDSDPCYDISGDKIVGTADILMVLGAWNPRFADLNADGYVNDTDLNTLINSWGICESKNCHADLNEDGQVSTADLLLLLGEWTGN